MNTETQQFLGALSALAQSLRSRGQIGPSRFFEGLKIKLEKNPAVEAKNVAMDVVGAGKLSDLANFTHTEDKLFDEVFRAAKIYLGE